MVEITFERFFRAIRGVDPFPWQSRLASLAAEGAWPDVIGVPTGLGKTVAIDAAVWALASQAGTTPRERTAPTRVWYVVNRRLLVDGAYEHGRRLAAWLADPDSAREQGAQDLEAIAWVGERLRSLATFGDQFGPLHVTRLRGGADLGVRPPDASQPALIFSTVPMYASRLMFRGYGSSTSMWPIDAALAGTDSLVLLDEAHLARSLIKVAAQLEEADIGDPSRVISAVRARPRIVQMTATGDTSGHVLDLARDDLSHPIVQQRVNAAKRLIVRESKRNRLTRDISSRVVELVNASSEPPSIAVMVNGPSTARSVLAELGKAFKGHHLEPELVMLTGLMREREAEAVRNRLMDPDEGVPAGVVVPLRRPLVVVATQTLEVGADLDFGHLVTESCGIRALVQRVGRVNRLGVRIGSTVTVVHPTDLKEDPLYEGDRGLLWERLLEAGEDADLSPRSINDLVGAPQDQPPRSGELLPHHLWEWAKTTRAWSRGAPPELFYDALEPDRSVSVVWRLWVPSADESTRELYPPVIGGEAVEIPVWELRSAFERDAVVDRLDSSKTLLERVAISEVNPGDVVVLPAESGRYDRHGWSPASDSFVPDLSLFVAGLPIAGTVACHLLSDGEPLPDVWHRVEEFARAVIEAEGDDDAPKREFTAALADLLRQSRPPSWVAADERGTWVKWVEGLVAPSAGERLHIKAGTAFLSLPRGGLVRRDEADELSVTGEQVGLFDHLEEVADFSARIARAVGVESGLVDSLSDAGRLHDIGKADPRFQRWLDPSGVAERLLAKSNTPPVAWETHRRRAGWPRGGRHELTSARIADHLCSSRSDRDVVVHLVASHHGHGRPFVSIVEGAGSIPLSVDCWGIRVEARSALSEPDFDQPARFRRLCQEFGYWGLALLEAVVRQADHIASKRARVA